MFNHQRNQCNKQNTCSKIIALVAGTHSMKRKYRSHVLWRLTSNSSFTRRTENQRGHFTYGSLYVHVYFIKRHTRLLRSFTWVFNRRTVIHTVWYWYGLVYSRYWRIPYESYIYRTRCEGLCHSRSPVFFRIVYHGWPDEKNTRNPNR